MTLPSTSLPCPPWCTLPAGHPFDSTDSSGTLFERFHARHAGESELSSLERALGNDGPAEQLPVRILGPTGEDLTGPQARALAAALVEAADEWDQLEGDREASR